MKKFGFLLLLVLSFHLNAQKNDNVWLLGYHYYPSYVPALDFYFGYPDTIGWNVPPATDFFGANASICNDAGDMMLYTDGTDMFNYANTPIAGSGGFNDDSTSSLQGVSVPKQSLIVLPFPDAALTYAVFHLPAHVANNNITFQPLQFSWSTVDMNLNSGLGQMILKDSMILSDTLMFGTLLVTKHGNGRDWWIINHRWKSDVFYICLLTPSGITQVLQQSVGPYLYTGFYNYTSQCAFSQDGNKFAICDGDTNNMHLFNFDRCSGNISFQETVALFPFTNELTATGCSFSPDSKLLYVTSLSHLIQFDTDSFPLASTFKSIATWDGTYDVINATSFFAHRHGPDGKIYISGGVTHFLHVINDPDNRDTACNFTQHSLRLKTFGSATLPEFPNYRLEAAQGSGCDTITVSLSGSLSIFTLKLFPNPASEQVTINYSLPGNNKGLLQIMDVTGRKRNEIKIPEYSYTQLISLKDFAPGVYFLQILSGGHKQTAKLIIYK